jgi:hypothetical protein
VKGTVGVLLLISKILHVECEIVEPVFEIKYDYLEYLESKAYLEYLVVLGVFYVGLFPVAGPYHFKT